MHHEYASKELLFNVLSEEFVTGDINGDGDVNVIDVVVLVNVILGFEEENSSSDLNNDGSINVLDVVLLVNLILYEL